MIKKRVGLAILLTLIAASEIASADAQSDCKKLQIKYFNAMRPVLYLSGSDKFVEDADPATIEMVIVPDNSPLAGTVSADGQAIFDSAASLHSSSDSAKQARLQMQMTAMLRRIAAQEHPDPCPTR